MTFTRARALLLDLDGTLLDSTGTIRPRVRAALHELHGTGVRVMVVTGRSAISTLPVLEELGLEGPAVIFNGAGVIDPRREKWLEERVLSNRVTARALEFTAQRDLQAVVMCAGAKYATPPRDEVEELTLRGLHGVVTVERDALPSENVIRFSWFSREHADSASFARELDGVIEDPIYVTHFPLNVLPEHRSSSVQVLDIHPPCKGKAEALRFLEERYGIAAQDVVAVGDATNDIPMLRAAGLGVVMGSGMPEALACADRVIGTNDSDALAELAAELLAPAL